MVGRGEIAAMSGPLASLRLLTQALAACRSHSGLDWYPVMVELVMAENANFRRWLKRLLSNLMSRRRILMVQIGNRREIYP